VDRGQPAFGDLVAVGQQLREQRRHLAGPVVVQLPLMVQLRRRDVPLDEPVLLAAEFTLDLREQPGRRDQWIDRPEHLGILEPVRVGEVPGDQLLADHVVLRQDALPEADQL